VTTEDEIERLRTALAAETGRRRELQIRLDQARSGFEDFVSVAAHDLREPLRDISAFSQLLAEANAGRSESDPDAAAFLERIRQGAERMQALLTDVVDYWSIGAGAPQGGATSMEAVLDHALRVGKMAAVVTHDPLPLVCGDFDILAKVLHHLLRNAVEYCGRPDPCIHISSKSRELECVISVQDNGPGIDPAFHHRIFEPFKRLHGKEFPGNGLGLAFCRKAIEWQGGRIWVESAGAGATFCFTLPV
jgi:signal transduction histidine kinase